MLANPPLPIPAPAPWGGDEEALVLRLQIEEITRALDFLVAQRLAMDGAFQLSPPAPTASEQDVAIDPEEEALRQELEQLLVLEQTVQVQEMQSQEERANVQVQQQAVLAQQLSESFNLDEQIAKHDHNFAAALASVSAQEWDEFGDQIDDLFELPLPPVVQNPSSASHVAAPSNAASGSSVQLQPCCRSSEPDSQHSSTIPSTSASPSWCNICLEQIHTSELVSAGDASAPSSSSSLPGCGHLSCRPCMRQYTQSELAARRYPIKCPDPTCTKTLEHATVVSLLQDSQEDMQALHQAEIESAVSPSQRLYCPHKDCSALLVKSGQEEANEPLQCPHCNRAFCPSCLVPGWHQGFTCQAFQRLPAEHRSVEDAALLNVAAKQLWKKCPSCCMVVERTTGCNHVRCRCGADFCYQCGKQYASRQATAANVHGTPACQCQLFDVPAEAPDVPVAHGPQEMLRRLMGAAVHEDAAPLDPQEMLRHLMRGAVHGDDDAPDWPDEDEDEVEEEEEVLRPRAPVGLAAAVRDAAPAAAAPAVPHRAAPVWRGGRKVSHTPCWHSRSIAHCPRGQRCWFRHEEDGLL